MCFEESARCRHFPGCRHFPVVPTWHAAAVLTLLVDIAAVHALRAAATPVATVWWQGGICLIHHELSAGVGVLHGSVCVDWCGVWAHNVGIWRQGNTWAEGSIAQRNDHKHDVQQRVLLRLRRWRDHRDVAQRGAQVQHDIVRCDRAASSNHRGDGHIKTTVQHDTMRRNRVSGQAVGCRLYRLHRLHRLYRLHRLHR